MMKRNHYFIRILRRIQLLQHLSFQYPINFNGKKFTIPLIEGLNEPLIHAKPSFKTEIFQKINQIRTLSDFIDIGANFGQTLLEVMGVSGKINYFGFEPNPIAYGLLQRLVEVNSITANLFPCACSNRKQPKKIYKNSSSHYKFVDSGATLKPETRPSMYSEKDASWINCITLDEIVGMIELSKNFLLKIDVEGSEMEVLEGAKYCFDSLRPIVLCEVLHAHSEQMLTTSREHKLQIQKFLQKNNYDIYLCELELGSNQLKAIKPIDNFPNGLYYESPNTCDYLFAPKEFHLFSK